MLEYYSKQEYNAMKATLTKKIKMLEKEVKKLQNKLQNK